MDEPCQHPNVAYEAGNYVPPFGWEIMPGLYCEDCGEIMDPEDDEDPDHAQVEGEW